MLYRILILSIYLTVEIFSFSQIDHLELGRKYFAAEKYNSAASEFENCSETNELCKYLLGQTYMYQEKYNKALEQFNSISSFDQVRPYQSGFLNWDISECYERLGKIDSAILSGKKEFSNPYFQAHSNIVKCQLYFHLGGCYYDIQKYDSATTYLSMANRLDTTNENCLYTLVKAHWFDGNRDTSFALIDQILTKSPDNLTFILLRGDLMFDASIDGAIHCYNKAIALGYKPKGVRKKSIRLLNRLEKVQN